MLRSALPTIVAVIAGGIGSSVAQTVESTDVDAKAMAALQKMGTYLRSLSAYRVQAVTTDEDVLEDGQKIQYSESVDILAKTPSHLWVQVVSDRRERILFYDGKTLNVFAPRVGYYASLAAPGTIVQLDTMLVKDYDLSIPLRDLFQWGAGGLNSAGIESVIDVGPSQVNGTTCEQYAVRQKDFDWQIWLQLGAYPLPRKIVISDRTDAERPQHTAVYTWDLAPSFNDATFTFDPPPWAHRVPLAKSAFVASASPNQAAPSR